MRIKWQKFITFLFKRPLTSCIIAMRMVYEDAMCTLNLQTRQSHHNSCLSFL